VLVGVMDSYRHGVAVLNLPAYFKGYPGRVVEALAAGVPMVTNQLDNRPKTQATFDQRRHILYYDPKDPADLARQLDDLVADPALQRDMVVNGRARLLESLTSEVQMPALLAWIDQTSGSWLRRLARRIRGL
jgi:glycosyltransferase involved in cell wall biosynthesis